MAGDKGSISELIEQLEQTEHGFKYIEQAGNELLADRLISHMDTALWLLKQESYQARMLAVYLLGRLSIHHAQAMFTLRNVVGKDANWRVQEMLAKAFDYYCSEKGYEESLPTITKWLSDKNCNIKRAVVEGLRIWTGRPYFNRYPEHAIRLISEHKADDSEYLRKSVGNALHDIRKKYPELVDTETASWDITDAKVAFTKKLVDRK